MIEMTSEYWHELANQFIFISSLLTGFSIAVIANIIVSDSNKKISNYILTAATLAASCFLVSVFAMAKISMMTTPGYPLAIDENSFTLPRIIASLTLVFGILSLSALIGLSGWSNSKRMGIFTTIIAVITLTLIVIVA